MLMLAWSQDGQWLRLQAVGSWGIWAHLRHSLTLLSGTTRYPSFTCSFPCLSPRTSRVSKEPRFPSRRMVHGSGDGHSSPWGVAAPGPAQETEQGVGNKRCSHAHVHTGWGGQDAPLQPCFL